MEARLFLNGFPPDADYLCEEAKKSIFTVCADGAYNYLKGIIKPDVIIGDLDSINCEVEDGISVVKYNPDKDYTDGHLCLEFLIERGYNYIRILGASGGRADHFYANLSLLYLAEKQGVKAEIDDKYQKIVLFNGKMSLQGLKGLTISLVPFLGEAHIIITKGLKYPIQNKTLNRLHILGISNVAVDDNIEVITEGELLVFIEKVSTEGV